MPISRRRTIAGLSAAALAVAMHAFVAPPGVASATDPTTRPHDPAPAIPDSASVAAPVVAQGTLRSPSGAPESGEVVLLQAWPGPDVLRELEPGDTVNLVTVAKAFTSADGRYELRVGESGMGALARYATRSGLVDLELLAPAAPPFSFSRRLVPGQRGVELHRPDSAGASVAEARRPEEVSVLTAADGRGPRLTSETASGETAVAVEKSCTTKFMRWAGSPRTLVGQTYANVDGVWHRFTYSSGATSTLGVGVSMTGGFGNYSASGTNSRETNDSSSYEAVKGGNPEHRYYDTWFRYGEYKTSCTSGTVGPIWPWKIRAAYWEGGAVHRVLSSSPTAPYCRKWEQGSEFTKEKTAAVTWGNGVDLSAMIGIDLSSRTGYSSTAKLHYVFNKTRALCGTNDYPAYSASRIVIRRASAAS